MPDDAKRIGVTGIARTTGPKRRLWIIAAVTCFAVVLILFLFFSPALTYYWGYESFKSLFHDNLSFGLYVSEVLAVFFAVVQAILAPYSLYWLLLGKKKFVPIASFLVIFGLSPLLHALLDSNFNQATGQAQKWYYRAPNGAILLSDSGGFDPKTGAAKHLLTPAIATIIAREQAGIRPHPVNGDPRQLQFFDSATGRATIWYYKGNSTGYHLFDAEGFYPGTGTLLLPVTPPIVSAILKEAGANAARAKAAAQAEAAQAEAARVAAAQLAQMRAKEEARKRLMRLFETDSFPLGAVLVGLQGRTAGDRDSSAAATRLIRGVSSALSDKGLRPVELAPGVYASPYFAELVRGDTGVLTEAGLASKIRSAVVGLVDASCHQGPARYAIVSCTVTVDIEVIRLDSRGLSSREVTEVGAGTSHDDALNRAVELLIKRHPRLLGAV